MGNNANINIQVNKGNVNVITTQGDINLKSGANIQLDAAQGIYLRSQTLNAEVDGDWNEKITGTNTKTGKTINLN